MPVRTVLPNDRETPVALAVALAGIVGVVVPLRDKVSDVVVGFAETVAPAGIPAPLTDSPMFAAVTSAVLMAVRVGLPLVVVAVLVAATVVVALRVGCATSGFGQSRL
jgi:hypothetical protein